MDEDKVWLLGTNLAWELFSSAIYNYRLSLNEIKNHKRHAFYKNVILNSVTAIEAYCNEILAKDKGWSEKEINECRDKLGEFGINYKESQFKHSKFIRNNFIVHHKRNDYRYYVEINHEAALEAIESSQDIIAEISFNRKTIFPYWITGLNFTNPSSGDDILYMNDCEFWNRFRQLGISKVIDDNMVSSFGKNAGKIYPPEDREIYDSLYKDLWKELKRCNFKLKILNSLKSDRFPTRPFLTSEWWIES